LLKSNDDCNLVKFNGSHESNTSLVAGIFDTLSTASLNPDKHCEYKARFEPKKLVYLFSNFMKNEKRASNELKNSHDC
jgi:hypothetical protein